MKQILVLAAMVAALMGVTEANASVIVGWDLNDGRTPGGQNNFGPSPLSAGDIAANISSVGLTRYQSLTTNNPNGAANAWGANNFNITTPSFASAIANSNFFTFSITSNANFVLNLSSIDAYNIRRSNTGPTTGRWQYSVGTGSFIDLTSDITWGATTNSAGNAQAAINLTGIAALQGVSETVTFRVVTWGATSSGGTWYFNTKGAGLDLSVDGTVSAVPEPSALFLVGSIFAVGVVRRRRS